MLDDSGEIKISLSTSAGSGKVFARAFNSEGQIVAIKIFNLSSGKATETLETPKSDGTVGSTGSNASVESGSYTLHIAVDYDGGNDFSSNGKVHISSIEVKGNVSKSLTDSDFSSTVTQNVSVSTSDGHSFTADSLYCFWFLEKTLPEWGSISGGNVISTVSNTSLSGSSGTTSGLHTTWFGLVAGKKYNLYCFVDEGGVSGFPDYNSEYQGKATSVYISGSGSTSISLSKIIE